VKRFILFLVVALVMSATRGVTMPVQNEQGGGRTPTPPAWLRNKPGAVQPPKPKDAYYKAPNFGSGGSPFGNQQGGSLPAWAIPANTTVYGPPKPQGYGSSFGNQQAGPLPAWATVNTPSTMGYKPPVTPAPFYTAAQLPKQNLPQWMQVKGEQFAYRNDPAAYMEAAAATQQPQNPYIYGPATQPAPFMTADMLPPPSTQQPVAVTPPTIPYYNDYYSKRLSNPKKKGFGTNYGGGWSSGYDNGGGGNGYVPSWLMGLYSWNFKG
jgi:hypothetical protein